MLLLSLSKDKAKEALEKIRVGEANFTYAYNQLRGDYGKISAEMTAVRKMNESLVNKVEDLTCEKAVLQDRVVAEKTLNKELLRISRERANAKRGISSKKSDGYMVIRTAQVTEYFYVDEAGNIVDNASEQGCEKCGQTAYRTTFESFYDCTIPLMAVEGRIIEELFDGGILPSMGCCFCNEAQYNGRYTSFENGRCGCYKWAFSADAQRGGMWLVDIYTTAPLVIPPDRIATKKEKSKS